jgi:DNA polymerase III delta subunit
MKFYEFLDKRPAIGRLVVVEGAERLLAERAVAAIVERVLEPAERDLNLDRFAAADVESFAPLEAAAAALPFLGSRRLIVFRGAHEMAVDRRRKLLAAAERVPESTTLVIEDLVSPAAKRPEPLGRLLGRAALRIDTTPSHEARARFLRETLADLGASAAPAAFAALMNEESDFGALRTDLEKLALAGATIELDDVERETLASKNVRAYKFAAAAAAGRLREALALAAEMFSNDPRGAAIPLFAALAAEYALVWEAARPGGELPPQARWRAGELGATARRIGQRGARRGFERAVRGFEAIVTGLADDPRVALEAAAAAAAEPSG